jgi:stage V sporulation protein G
MPTKTQTLVAAPEPQESQAAPALPMSYEARIHSLRMNGSTRGNASVTLNGQFGVRGVNVREGPNGLFVSMPSRKDAGDVYRDVCFPCTKESRAEFDKAVLSAFDKALAGGFDSQNQAPAEVLPIQYVVRIHSLHPGAGTLKGTASVNINDQFAVRSVRIMEGSNGMFVSTPGYKGGNGMFKDYCYPCTKESRAEFNKAVIDAYEQALTQSQAQRSPDRQQAGSPAPAEQGAQSYAPVMQM